LIAARYGTPFVVAHKVGLGGLVFILGRLAVAAAHELAHGLTMASYGRQVEAVGMKLVLVFPYVFVDTSNAWFEPRRRRITTSAAGPVCDLLLGGVFAICCAAVPSGPLRDIMFQLAFGAYYAALFNLNPFLDRDGYHILVDVLRRPGLRRSALQQLRERLAGRNDGTGSRLLQRYAILTLAWTALAAGFVALLSLRYVPILGAVLPGPVAYALIGLLWLGLLAPLSLILAPPMWARLRERGT
jgi:putative peptide zinc metalloprotease protein